MYDGERCVVGSPTGAWILVPSVKNFSQFWFRRRVRSKFVRLAVSKDLDMTIQEAEDMRKVDWPMHHGIRAAGLCICVLKRDASAFDWRL